MEDFLLKYSSAPKEFILDFFDIAKEKYNDNDIIIRFDFVVKWLDVKKGNLKQKLVADFIEDIDYKIEKKTVPHKGKSGATHVEIIKITPNCFKHLCMMSQTKKAKEVRLYFLNIEKIVRQYHQEIQEKIEKELALVKYNQKPKVRRGEKGKVYVFEAFNSEDTLYKLGNTKDLETRLKTYNTGLANDLKILFELEVNDIDMVEDCAKAFLKQFQYRKRKEIYETSVAMISGMLEKCKIFSESVTEFFEQHKKEFKEGTQRLKKKDGNFFMFIKKNDKNKSKSKSDAKIKKKVAKQNDDSDCDLKNEKPKKVKKKVAK